MSLLVVPQKYMGLIAKAFNLTIFNFNMCGRKLKMEVHVAKTTVFISLFVKEGCKDPMQCFSLTVLCMARFTEKRKALPYNRNTMREQKQNGSSNKTRQ